MRYLIEHEVVVRFATAVQDHHCELRLTPLERDQHCRRVVVSTRPPATIRATEDGFGNVVTSCSVAGELRTLRIRVDAEVETTLENPFAFQPAADSRGTAVAR
jgi:transglutaminase-like putative cysteine protease